MKNFIIFLLVAVLFGSASFATLSMTHSHSGQTLIGFNKLVWGYFTNANTIEGTLTTGLNTIRAFGLNITSEADLASPLKTTISGGTISVTSVSDAPDGFWWAIGR